jgi:lambda family phage tail tape measure protein
VSDFDFEMKADPSPALAAARQVEDGLGRVELRAKRAGDEMTSAFERAAEGARSIMEVLGLLEAGHLAETVLDGYTEIENKLRVVTSSQENLNGVMEATLGIANETRTSWEEQVGTYQRLANVTAGLGLSQRDVLDLQLEISQATKISGASAMEAGMAMRELSHAFETGSLTAREYKVLMRDTPALMNELRVASGLTSGQFAELAHSGQLSAQKLIEWFGKAKDDIAEKFGRTIPTIGDDMTILRNEAVRFFGEAGAGAGIMTALGNATRFVVDHFETFGRIVLGVVEALGGMLIIGKAIALLQALAAAVAANPLGALLTALVVGVSLLRQFGDSLETNDRVMTKAGETAVTVGDYLRGLWTMIKELASAIYELLAGAWKALTEAFQKTIDSESVSISLRDVLMMFASFADAAVAIFKVMGHTIEAIFDDAATALGVAFQEVLNKIIRAANSLRQSMLDVLNETDRMAAIHRANADRQVDYVRAFQASIQRGEGPVAASNAGFGAENAISWEERKKQAFLGAGFDASGQQQAGGIGEVNIVDPRAASAFKDKLGGQIAKDLETSIFKELVDNGLTRLSELAKDSARRRGNEITGSMISDAKRVADAHTATDKEQAAFEKLKNELRGVLEATNPQTEAEEKLAHAQEILNKVVVEGNTVLVGMIAAHGGVEKVMKDFRNRLDDQLHPLDAIIRKITEHTAALRGDREEQERALEVTKKVEQLKKAQGGPVTDGQLHEIETAVRLAREREQLTNAEQNLTKSILGPQKEYELNLRAINALHDGGKISAQQYAKGVEDIGDAYAAATPLGKTFTFGLSKGLRDIRDEVTDVASQVRKTLSDAFHGVENAIVDLVTKGKTDWHAMVESMLADMTRLLLRQGLSSVLPGLNLQGFATGGSGIVSGAGGTDSQVVAFRATPGERVTVETPEQQRAGRGGAPGGDFHAHMIVVANQEQAAIAAMGTRAGERTSIATVHRNQRTISHVLRR